MSRAIRTSIRTLLVWSSDRCTMRFALSRVGAAISTSTCAEARSCAVAQSPAFVFPIHAAGNAVLLFFSKIRSFHDRKPRFRSIAAIRPVVECSITAPRPKRSGGGAAKHLDRARATGHSFMRPP
jgi:hypothetical protein